MCTNAGVNRIVLEKHADGSRADTRSPTSSKTGSNYRTHHRDELEIKTMFI